MNFSVNQVRQLYVAKTVASSDVSNVGDIKLKNDAAKSYMYFDYMGAGGRIRTDLIDLDKIMWIKATPASALARYTKVVKLKMDTSVSENPEPGQDYMIRITLRQHNGMSDEDITTKYAIARAFTNETPITLYSKLLVSLWRNFSREPSPILEFKANGKVVAGVKFDSASGKHVPVDETGATITPTAEGIEIGEVAQPWRRGVMEQVPVYFDITTAPVVVNGEERVWGTTSEEKGTKIGDGKKIADLEYFCMGERGDIYRGVGFPNNIETEYLVDPSKEYHTLDIHFFYQGANEAVQKSEKTMTIVSDSDSVINSLVEAINSLTDMEIDQLS